MRIKVKQYSDDIHGSDMVVIRDESGTVFTVCHIDLFSVSRYRHEKFDSDSWRSRNWLYNQLDAGEEVTLELVKVDYDG